MTDEDEIAALRKLSEAYVVRLAAAIAAGFLLMVVLDRVGTAGSQWAGILAMVSFVLICFYALFAWACLFRVRMRLRASRRQGR